MGLPMWRAPSPDAKPAVKADPTAPARSPIRRRSPWAAGRARPIRSPRSPRLREHQRDSLLAQAASLPPLDSISRPSSNRPRLQVPPPPVPESRNYARHGGSAQESALTDDDSRAHLIRDRYYRAMHNTRPSFGEVSRSTLRRLPDLTPNFAPAAAALEQRERSSLAARSEQHRALARRRPTPATSDSLTNRSSLSISDSLLTVEDSDEEDTGNSNAVGFPPLRRMGRRTIADGPLPSSSLREGWGSPVAALDGLGDRERSVSPVDDHWDAILQGVVPDPVAPTAESSFASAAASASFSNSHPSSRAGSSNSNSASSSRTHLTVPSRRSSPYREYPFQVGCETSEDDTASDTEAEEMDIRPDTRPIHRRQRSRPSYFADEPPTRNPDRYSQSVHERSRNASSYVRSFYGSVSDNTQRSERLLDNQLDGPADEASNLEDELQTLDQELRDARSILERLTRRDDIGDDFWASVGLTRPLADRVERVQQRDRL